MTRIGSPRLGGTALVVGSLLLLVGGFFHPRGEGSGVDAFAHLIADNILVWFPVHTLLLLGPPFLMLGFFTLFRTQTEAGERLYSLPAILSLGLGATMLTIGIVFDGFVSPLLAQKYLDATAARETAALLLDYNNLVYLSLLAPSLFLLLLGAALFGLSLAKAKAYSPWFAWSGVAIGLAGIAGYVAGVFGPYWVSSPLFAPYIALFLLWVLLLGLFPWIPSPVRLSPRQAEG